MAGRWVQSRVDGDMDQLLQDNGVGWAIRKMAKSMNYGCGQTFSTVTPDAGDANRVKIVMEFPGAKVPTTMEFAAGQPGWQETVGGGDGPMLIKGHWDGPVLVMESKPKSGAGTVVHTRRWADPATGELKISSATSKGQDAVRVFTRV